MARRMERVNQLLREELSDLLQRQLKDPRLGALMTITEVDVSPDLRHARVYVSVMGDAEEQQAAIDALSAAAGFLRRGLRGRLKLRNVPELQFHHDRAMEHGSHLLTLIDQVSPTTVADEGSEQ